MLKMFPQVSFATIKLLLPNKYMFFGDVQQCKFNRTFNSNSESSDKPPKRPWNPFLRFSRNVFPELLKKYPDPKNYDNPSMITDLWNSLDRKEKKKIYDSYYKDLEEYHFACLEYECKLSKDSSKKKIPDKTAKKEKRKIAALRTLSGKPKKPPNAFLLFLETQRDSKPEKSTMFQWVKECAVRYQRLPDNEKAAFTIRAKELENIHKIEKYEWEDKVTKLGCTDILPKRSQFSKHPPEDDNS